jgi:hypothetical protein
LDAGQFCMPSVPCCRRPKTCTAPDITSLLLFLLGDIPTHREEIHFMCRNGLVNSGEPSTAFRRLDVDKKLYKRRSNSRRALAVTGNA